MRVLITRPRPQAEAMARALRRRGHHCTIDPVMRIERRTFADDGQPVDAVILTSANAAFALGGRLLDLPVVAVGEATARAARRRGARHVEVADGDWQGVRDLVLRGTVAPPGGRFLHLAGRHTAGALDEALKAAGYQFDRKVVYDAVLQETLSLRTRRALEERAIDAVVFLSPRSSTQWCELVDHANLAGRLDRVVACCLSPAVAEPVRRLVWREVRIAARRDQTALLDCLDGGEERC